MLNTKKIQKEDWLILFVSVILFDLIAILFKESLFVVILLSCVIGCCSFINFDEQKLFVSLDKTPYELYWKSFFSIIFVFAIYIGMFISRNIQSISFFNVLEFFCLISIVIGMSVLVKLKVDNRINTVEDDLYFRAKLVNKYFNTKNPEKIIFVSNELLESSIIKLNENPEIVENSLRLKEIRATILSINKLTKRRIIYPDSKELRQVNIKSTVNLFIAFKNVLIQMDEVFFDRELLMYIENLTENEFNKLKSKYNILLNDLTQITTNNIKLINEQNAIKTKNEINSKSLYLKNKINFL